MKKSFVYAFAGLFYASVAVAQNSVSVLGSYQTSDGDPGMGILGRYQYDVKPDDSSLRVLIQAGRLTGFGEESAYVSDNGMYQERDALELDVTAIETAVLWDFLNRSGWAGYAGVGAGYYIPDISRSYGVTESYDLVDVETGTEIEADNAIGFFALVGVEKKLGEHWALFGEVRYTAVKIDYTITESWEASTDYFSIGYEYESEGEYDLTGINGAVGIAYRW